MPKSSGYDPRAVSALLQYAPKSGDPLAFIATALIESGLRPNAVGDSGHSHGLFQLNDRGRLASYKLSPQQAYDPAINASVSADEFSKLAAKGLRGSQLALAAQRPSDPAYAQKFAAALPMAEQILKSSGLQSSFSAQDLQPAAGKLDARRLLMLLRNQSGRSLRGIMPAANFRKELAKLAGQAYSASTAERASAATAATSGYAGPSSSGDYGWSNDLSKQFGLQISSTYRDPAKNRQVGGSPTSAHMIKGGATDFSGPPEAMRRLAKWAVESGMFKEVFYDPLGYYWDNGRVNRGGIGGHSDHVHITR